MIDRLESIFDATVQAIGLVLEDAVAVNPWWVVLGLLVHVASQIIRNRAWWNIIRASYPEGARELRWREVVKGYFGGAGLNSVIPARGGDVVKLAIVHRHVDGAKYTTLAGTLVPETIPETIMGTALLVWALTQGWLPVPTSPNEWPSVDVSWALQHPGLAIAGIAVVTVLGVLAWRYLRHHGRIFLDRLRQGFAILGDRRAFVEQVVSWQVVGRVVRLASLACLMAAFGLPVTLGTALLVMAAQGGGRIIPIAPASAGLRLAMLSYGLVEITGEPVDISNITAFTVMTGVFMMVLGLAISIVIVLREFGTLSPRKALHAAREVVAGGRAKLREEGATG